MTDIQSPDPGRKVARRYNIVGPPPVLFLSPELVPVTIIDNLAEESPGVKWGIVGGDRAGVAAQFNQTRLANRLGSGVVLEQITLHVSSNTAQTWQIGTAGALPGRHPANDLARRQERGNPIGSGCRG